MKNLFGAALLTLTAVFLLSACSSSQKSTDSMASPQNTSSSSQNEKSSHVEYVKITAEEAKKMMDAGGVTVVDVRREDEYAEKHIPGGVLVPNETINSTMPPMLPDKDAVLLVYCRTGSRSSQASEKLIAMGYTHVYDFGGIIDWPYETESGEAK